jgi:D-aminopeptidase
LKDWRPSPPEGHPDQQDSSIIMVLATDAPLDPRQLERVSLRAGAGLARTGGLLSTTSGDFVIAFSTANRVPHFPAGPVIEQRLIAESPLETRGAWPIPPINWLFQAAAEAVEEAILNSLCMAQTMTGRDGHVRPALPLAETARILQRHGRTQVLWP